MPQCMSGAPRQSSSLSDLVRTTDRGHGRLCIYTVGTALGDLGTRFSKFAWRALYPNLASFCDRMELRPSFRRCRPTRTHPLPLAVAEHSCHIPDATFDLPSQPLRPRDTPASRRPPFEEHQRLRHRSHRRELRACAMLTSRRYRSRPWAAPDTSVRDIPGSWKIPSAVVILEQQDRQLLERIINRCNSCAIPWHLGHQLECMAFSTNAMPSLRA
jgi:hypothetical protein